MARLTFPKFDPTVTLDRNPVSDDPVIKRLTKIFKDAMVVRDRLHDAHAKAFNIAGGHGWVAPKDPKVIKAMKDAKKDVDDARDELRQAFKERGIDIAAQHQANMDLLDKISAQTREAMRKAGLGETLERLEHRNAPMNMKHLIERCEREALVEFDPNLLATLAVPALAASWPLASLGKNAVDNIKDRREGAAQRNRDAEGCHRRGGKDCRCADGYHMDKGKCLPSKGIKNRFSRFLSKSED